MLEADKRLLVRDLELNLLVLRERELNHFLRCIETFGAPAALLAGCAFSGIANARLVPRGTHWAPEVLYYIFTTAAMCILIHVSLRGTMLSILGPRVALRGRDAEAMHHAVREMERLFLGMWGRLAFGAVCLAIGISLFIYIQESLVLSISMAVYIFAFSVGISRDFFRIGTRFSVDPGTLERAEYSGDEVRRLALTRTGTRATVWSRGADKGSYLRARGLIEAVDGGAGAPSREPGWLSASKGTLTRTFTSRALRSPVAGTSPSHALPAPASTRIFVTAVENDASLQREAPPKRRLLPQGTRARPWLPARSASLSRDDGHGLARSSPCAKGGGAGDGSTAARAFGAGLALDLTRHELAEGSRDAHYDERLPRAGPWLIDVVVTLRHGARLRWRVPAELSVAELLVQAERVFDQPLRALRDMSGHEISQPRTTPVSSQLHALDEEQSLAFFQAVPTAAQSPFTMVQTLWDDYLHGG